MSFALGEYSNVRRQNASLERGILFLDPVHFYARHGGLAKMPARAKQFALAPRARHFVFGPGETLVMPCSPVGSHMAIKVGFPRELKQLSSRPSSRVFCFLRTFLIL